MKKTLALILAVALVLVLFAACGDNRPTATEPPATAAPEKTPTPTSAPGETTAPAEPTPGEPVSNLPFAVDEDGVAAEPYNYELPLTTSDDVLTYWLTNYSMQYLPTDRGYGETDLPMEAKNRTGVNVEYIVLPPTARAENFAVLLNSDDLCDIMSNASMYYPGSPLQAIEDEYLVNIYDYKDFMPNYLYEVKNSGVDAATYEAVFFAEDVVPYAYCLTKNAPQIEMGYCIRQDWLDKLDMKADEIVTWDDLENALGLIKSNIDTCEFPMWLSGTLEATGNWQFNSFGNLSQIVTISLPPVFLKDGSVVLGCTTDGDRQLVTKLNSFMNAGLINPDWSSYIYAALFSNRTYNNEVAYQTMSAAGIVEANKLTADPNCDWAPIQKPLVTADQVMHVGSIRTRIGAGNVAFAVKNTNLELAMKWMDYRYSPEGWELYAYGPEGKITEIGEDGKRRNTEWALNNPDGIPLSGLVGVYTIGALVEAGISASDVQLLHEGGAKPLAAVASWTTWMNEHYDAADAYPLGARLNSEQQDALRIYSSDIITYIAENFSAFIDGSRNVNEWDDYVATLNTLGLQDILDLYQDAYDDYLAKQ